MAHKLVVLEWMYKADQDFGFAKSTLSYPRKYFDQICFFFQQTAEKYLKAYIVKFDLKFAKMHDLVKLLSICATHDNSLGILEEDCQFLNSFYLETRYTDLIFAKHTKEQAEEALFRAEKIQRVIREKLAINNEITLEDIQKENKKVDEELKKLH